MKKLLLAGIVSLISLTSFSQLLSWSPNFPTDTGSPLVITMDASYGNTGLLNYTPTNDVFVHTGVITNLSTTNSDWKHVKFSSFNVGDPSVQTTYLGNNKWQFTISPDIRTFYGVPAGETIQKIAILFRNGAGSKVQRNTDGSDMYIPISTTSLDARIINPFKQPTYTPQAEPITKNVGDNISITGVSNNSATLKLSFNGTVIQTATNATSVTSSANIVVAGNQTIILEANDGTNLKSDTIKFFVSGTANVAPLPAGVRDGINYEANTSAVTLVLNAPGKTRVGVIGDFPGSNWAEQSAYQFNKTPDGNYWWLRITGLTPGTEYSYQYLVDGTLKIADPYTEKVLDPSNDQFISSATYPNLKPYPTGLTTGIVSTLQTGVTPYNWKVNNFNRPDKKSLLIYELLVRDFVQKHDWKTLTDTLNYLKNLGINTIEVMPFNEFEGNNSWGYNPDFYFAPDKYYGTANALKVFIDSCHSKGMAVVMDMVLNHSFGSSPMVQLYYDNANNRPAANNPWYNAVATHPFNVGFQFNHESLNTRYFVSRVMEHWLQNYKLDGFRFDLSKGFTQTNSGSDVNLWGQYDASRVAIWKRYYDTMQLKSPNSYTILEHFADNSEEKVLSDYGMMLWGNENYNYNQGTMGYNQSNFDYGIFTNRGWNNPNLVTYMESHDEERLMYKNEQFGNSAGTYNVKDIATALKRMEMAGGFFFTIPGPKMIWQFGELGYDYSINTCGDLSVNNNCRVDAKPIRWDYLQDANRKHLYDSWSRLMKLRANPLYKNTFTTNRITQDFNNMFKWMVVNTDTSSLVVVGNFDVTATNGSVTFPSAGVWYDYMNGNTPFAATGLSQSFLLQPGEYHVYVNRSSAALPVTITSFSGLNSGNLNKLNWTVANEINVQTYEIERSIDGQIFKNIASVLASGNSSYKYEDDISFLSIPTYYYRLKSIDKDGKYSFSNVLKLGAVFTANFVEVSPNPFVNILKIQVTSEIKDKVVLLLTDITGRQMIRKDIMISAGVSSINVENSERLPEGSYFLTISTSKQNQTIKVVKSN